MANISLRLLFAHWLAFFNALQQFFWDYTPRPLLSTFSPKLIEGDAEISPIVHVPQFRDPPDYAHPVDLATMCRVPVTLQMPSTPDVSCSVDRSDYDLDDASSVTADSSHFYLSMDILAWEPPVSQEDVPPTSPQVETEDDDVQTNMSSDGPRGLSFCPVLVGVTYIHSLLHLYMLLMMPSLFHHWFEDVLVYDTLSRKDGLNCSGCLYTSLWIIPWCLVRCGTRRAIAYLCWRRRRVACKSARPPIPRIVLIRVDGEAVPVHFAEDHQASIGACARASLEPSSVEAGYVPHDRAAAFGGGETDVMASFTSGDSNGVATEPEALSMRTISRQGELARVSDSIRLEPLTPRSSGDSQILTEEDEFSPVLVEVEKEMPQSVEEDVPGTLVWDIAVGVIGNFHDAEDEAGDIQPLEDNRIGPREGEDPDQNVTFGSQSLADDHGPEETETSECSMTASSSMGSQDTLNPANNLQFAVHDNSDVVGEVSSGAYHADGRPSRALEEKLGGDGADGERLAEQTPVTPFDTPMDVTFLEVVQPVFPVPFDEEIANEIDVLAKSLSPTLPETPVVNLPLLTATRDDVHFVDMDSMVPALLIEDVATRSPLQILCPVVPVVVINMKHDMKAGRQCAIPPGAKELNQDAFDWPVAGSENAATCGVFGIASSHEDSSYLPSPSIEDLHPAFSPIIDTKLPVGDIWTPIAPPVPATDCETDNPGVNTNLDFSVTSPNGMIAVPEKRELEAVILNETPQCSPGVRDPTGTHRSGLQGLGDSNPMTGIPAAPESPREPKTEGQARISNGVIISLSGQTIGHSGAWATELPTTKLIKGVLGCQEAGLPSTTFEERRTDELDDGKGYECDNMPSDRPPPERTLSASMHAPSQSLPSIRSKERTSQTPVFHETLLSLTCSVPVAKADDGGLDTKAIVEKMSEREQDISASIHAPTRVSKAEVQPVVSQSQDKTYRGHRRSVTKPAESEGKPVTTPNWAAMPDVVDAFRVFKEASRSGNTLRRASSITERTNRVPTAGVVGQKGTATNSLSSTCVTANIQSHWMYGNGLLLVRDFVPSDPTDFNLRTCTNLSRASKIHGMSAIPMQQRVSDVSPCALHRQMVSSGVQHQQSVLVPCMAELDPMFGSQRWTAYRG